jgi:hypothetical protein
VRNPCSVVLTHILCNCPIPTIGIGLRDRKASKKDLFVDPANRKEVEEAIESRSTLTDEATDLFQ